MKTLDLVPGTDEWNAVRAKHPTASEAPVMMGCSKRATRNDLLRMKATGAEQEFSAWVKEVLFERGHEIEAAARPFAEKIIGEELYQAVATDDDGYLLASFDGITMLGDAVWECKQWNEAKAADVREGRIPEEDYWQVIQQLRVSGAEKVLYMVTDGTEEGTVYCWKLRATSLDDEIKLLNSWKQFAEDLENYEHKEVAPQAVGKAPKALPALHIEVTGMVTASNLDEFREQAMSLIESVNTDLQTDEDFASAEKAVKWCKDVESRLDAAKERALAQTTSIDELFRTVDSIKEEARAKRLELDKLVKARKDTIRGEILMNAKRALQAHMEKLNERIKPVRLPAYDADFAGAMKGKKTVKSLQDATDDVLAKAKIDTNQMADEIEANIKALDALAGQMYMHLFADLQNIVTKPEEDFAATVKARIAEHKESERKRIEAERERIRVEEERKAREKMEREKPEASIVTARKEAGTGSYEATRKLYTPPEETVRSSTERPSDQQIIDTLAKHYGVSHAQVAEWLLSMDFKQLRAA